MSGLETTKSESTSDAPIQRLHAGFGYHVDANGDVALASMSQRRRYTLSGLDTSSIVTILTELSRGIPKDDSAAFLAKRVDLRPKAVEALLSKLEAAGAVVTHDREVEDAERKFLSDGGALYDRQVRFLRLFETDHVTGLELNKRLQDRTVVVVGVGGLGGWIALHCARLGVRRIVAVDPDRVELSNLHRQALYNRGDIGKLKVEACRDSIAVANPDVEYVGHPVWIHSASDLVGLLDSADLVFNPFAYVPTLDPTAQAVAGAALRAGVPSLAVAVVMVGPLTVPGRTPCYWCGCSALEDEMELSSVSKAAAPGTTRGEAWPYLPAMPPRQAVAGSIAAWEGIRFLSEFSHPATLDHVVGIDLFGYTDHRRVDVTRRPDCQYCNLEKAPAAMTI